MPFFFDSRTGPVDLETVLSEILSPRQCTKNQMTSNGRCCKEKCPKEQERKEVSTTSTPQKFTVSFDVKGYKPEELKVNLDGRTLIIEGESEREEENGSIKRTFIRKYNLPEDLDLSNIKSSLQGQRLIVEVPKNFATAIPIQINRISTDKPEETPDVPRPKTPEGFVELGMD